VLLVSFTVLFVASSREPLGPTNSDYAALVNQAEDAVRSVADRGLGALRQPESLALLEALTKRPLAPLLSAWAALSVGRLGLLDGSSCVRLPWLVLAGFTPASVYWLLLRRGSVATALGGACWLLGSPGFLASALAVRPSALAVWSGWLVLVAAVCAARERRSREQLALLAVCALGAWLAFGLSYAVFWSLPVLLVHGWGARGSAALRGLRRGRLLVSTAALVVIAAAVVAVVCFDPLLWQPEVPALIRRLLEEEVPAPASVPRFGPFWLPALLGVVGLFVLARAALARRFATGEHRPKRDPSALGLLLVLVLFLAALSGLFGPNAGQEFSVQLLRLPLAILVTLGAAELAARAFTRDARARLLAQGALLALTLIVR
jgi:hypothetical protein